MKKLLILITLTAIACSEPIKVEEVKEVPKKDNTLDSLYRYKDSLQLDYDNYLRQQADSIAKYYK